MYLSRRTPEDVAVFGGTHKSPGHVSNLQGKEVETKELRRRGWRVEAQLPSQAIRECGNWCFKVGLVESAIRRCRIGMEDDQSIRLTIETERTIGSQDDQKCQRESG
jgi:hypothetical protein